MGSDVNSRASGGGGSPKIEFGPFSVVATHLVSLATMGSLPTNNAHNYRTTKYKTNWGKHANSILIPHSKSGLDTPLVPLRHTPLHVCTTNTRNSDTTMERLL